MDAFLSIKSDSEPNNKSAYISDLRKRLDFAYNTAAKEAFRQGHRQENL